MRGQNVTQKRDFYELLELQTGASATEVKSAYRRLARKYHPDVNPGDAEAEERFKAINEAYEVLSDPEKRERYDPFGHAGGNGGDGGLGAFSTVATCNRCGGRGRVIRNPCVQCHGAGVEQKRTTVKVKIPAGIDDGQRLVLRGEGEAGPEGGRAGDLYVFVHVKPHRVFQRRGLDLICEVSCSFS